MNKKRINTGIIRLFLSASLLGATFAQAGSVIGDFVERDGQVWAQPDLFYGLSWDEVNAVCPGGVCGSGAELNGWGLDGWAWASGNQVEELFFSYLGQYIPYNGGPTVDFLGQITVGHITGPIDTLTADILNDFRPTQGAAFDCCGYFAYDGVLAGWSSTGDAGANIGRSFSVMAGYSGIPNASDHAFISESAADSDFVFNPFQLSGWNLGAYFVRSDTVGSVPLPATWVLILPALAGLALQRRRGSNID